MADVKVGQKFRITYSSENATSVSALVRHEGSETGEEVVLQKVSVGDGYRDIWYADHLTTHAGWYYVLFKTIPAGGESATKFRASRTGGSSDSASVGTIRSVTSSTRS